MRPQGHISHLGIYRIVGFWGAFPVTRLELNKKGQQWLLGEGGPMVILNARLGTSPSMGRWLAVHGFRTRRMERHSDQMVRLSFLTHHEAHGRYEAAGTS